MDMDFVFSGRRLDSSAGRTPGKKYFTATICSSALVRSRRLRETGLNCHIKFRVVLLHIPGAVLFAKLADYRVHCVRFGNWFNPEFRLRAPGINANLRVLEYVLIPVRVGTMDWQQVKSVAFSDEPNGIRDGLARFSSDDAQFDFAVAREAIFEFLVTHQFHSMAGP